MVNIDRHPGQAASSATDVLSPSFLRANPLRLSAREVAVPLGTGWEPLLDHRSGLRLKFRNMSHGSRANVHYGSDLGFFSGLECDH